MYSQGAYLGKAINPHHNLILESMGGMENRGSVVQWVITI